MSPEVSKDDWRSRQHRLNLFVKKYLRGVGPILEDGDFGPATKKRIKQCQYWLGWEKTEARWSQKLAACLREPNDPKRSSKGTVKRGKQRRRKHNRAHYKSYLKPGVTSFDGVRVARVAVPILKWCRANGWDDGRLVSGHRDPAYSESLCRAMCGKPSCPGLCAGRASNHAGDTPEKFALDVSDYLKFAKVVARCPIKPRIFNDLPRDLVHFSPTGH